MSPTSEISIKKNEVTRLSNLKTRIYKDRQYLILLLPVICYFLLFHYVPMFGIMIAFKDFSYAKGIFGSPWAKMNGFANFIRFFKYVDFWILIRNTVLINFYSLIFSFPVPIILAILLYECKLRHYKKVIQTISYMPHFISVVIIVGMLAVMLSPRNGIVNIVLSTFGLNPIYFMAEAGWFRPLYVSSGIWQDAGFGAIIYLAALTSVNAELYEAANIDGATRIQRIWHISIPGITPTIVILFILTFGRLMNVGFEKAWLMQNGPNLEVSEIIATYIYKVGLLQGDFAYSTTIGLFNNVINLILVVIVNNICKRVAAISLW